MSPLKRILRILVLLTMLIMVDFSTAQGEGLPDSAYISGVVGHPQNYSISCEARSAVDLAAFWGFSIGETEFLNAMPSSDNPDEGYVGNPNEVWGRLPPYGYGVHAGPVAETLRDFGLEAQAHHDLSWDDLRGEISAGRPVIVWVIGGMWSGTAVDYVALDGSTARVAVFEHTMLLTGYSADGVQLIDAYTGQYQYYWLNSFLESWAVLGNMAVFASSDGNQAKDSQPVIHGDTYTVQPNDYLMALARDFAVSWQELAELNSISYPYTIFAGQVLQLPAREALETESVQESGPVEKANATEPASTAKVVNIVTRLPMVQRNSAIPYMPVMENTSTSKAVPDTAIVLHTDTLAGFGRSIGVAWHVLARLNNLSATSIVHPGEILKLK